MASGRLAVLLDRTSTILTIAAALALLYFVAAQHWSPPTTRDPDVRPTPLTKGDLLPLPAIQASRSRYSVVLVLSSQCTFCVDSVPFYRQLIEGRPPDVPVVGIFATPPGGGPDFVREHELRLDAVLETPLGEVGVRGTPTVLILDRESRVQGVWVGRLAAPVEEQVMTTLLKLQE